MTVLNAAREHVRKATTDGRINFWNYQCSVRETDALLGEEGMEKQREYEKLREAWDYPREVQRKPKEVEHNRQKAGTECIKSNELLFRFV